MTDQNESPLRHVRARTWVIIGVVIAIVVFLLPTLVAYRYTAASQRMTFVTHPWRSWTFLWTAITVPGGAQLKTSGAALRQADAQFTNTPVDVVQVRLLFLPAGKPYSFSQALGNKTVATTVVPPHRFVWQVEGNVRALAGEARLVIALYDYVSGRVLYTIVGDLPPGLPTPSPSASPSPGASTMAPAERSCS